MNILDTLAVVLKLDNTEFDKGMKESDKKTDDATKKMTEAEKAAKKLQDQLVRVAKDAVLAAAAILSIRHAAAGFSEAAHSAIELQMLSKATHESMENISAWGHATVEAGGDVKTFQSSLGNLNQGIQDLALTGDSSLSPAMRFLGMNFLDAHRKAKPLNDILLELSTKFEKMDSQKALEVGKRLGLDQATIFTLMKGRVAVEELLAKKKELGSLDAKNAETALKFNVIMDETHTSLEHLYMGIGSIVLPVLNLFLKGFNNIVDFMSEHKPFMYAMLAGLTMLLFQLASAAWAVVAPILVAAAPVIALSLAFAALAAGLAFIIDDLWNFYEGNDSVLGATIKKWEEFKDWLFGLWNQIADAISQFWDSLKPPEWLTAIIGHIGDLAGSAFNFTNAAAATPVNSMTSTSIVGGSARTVNNNIKATATVNAVPGDASGISKQLNSTMSDQLRSAVAGSDDGVWA